MPGNLSGAVPFSALIPGKRRFLHRRFHRFYAFWLFWHFCCRVLGNLVEGYFLVNDFLLPWILADFLNSCWFYCFCRFTVWPWEVPEDRQVYARSARSGGCAPIHKRFPGTDRFIYFLEKALNRWRRHRSVDTTAPWLHPRSSWQSAPAPRAPAARCSEHGAGAMEKCHSIGILDQAPQGYLNS